MHAPLVLRKAALSIQTCPHHILHTHIYTDAIIIKITRLKLIPKISIISINCINRSATISLCKISVDKSAHGIIC